MKICNSFILLTLLTPSAWAQNTILTTTNNVTDIISSVPLQTNIEVAKETSILEDLTNANLCSTNQTCGNLAPECITQLDTHPSCQGFADSLVPQGYKDKKWKSLFEVKYQPIETKGRNSLARAGYNAWDFTHYHQDNPVLDLKTAADLETEAKKIQTHYSGFSFGNAPAGMGVNSPPGGEVYTPNLNDIKMQLIIDQLTNPAFTKNDADMMDKIKNYSNGMNDQEFLNFVSTMAGYVDYNDDRAFFVQTPEAGLGVVTPFQQMMGTKAGVCGDIHSMAAKIAEQRGWEAFTVGYALEGMQHVVTAIVNPNDPNKLMVVNYGNYEEQTLNEGNSISPAPSQSGWEEMGTQLRIFKNNKTGDPTGKMQQIATVPTALGSFMNDLFKKEYQASKAMPANQNFSKEVAGGQTTKNKTEVSAGGNKITDKFVTEGLIIYEGETDNAKIYGVAVSHDVYKDIYRWDEAEQKCVLKKNKYFSVGLAGSLVDLTQAQFDNNFFVYLSMKGGQIFHLYQSEFFQFKGILGYELEGFGSMYDKTFLSGDGNFSTFYGVAADYNKNGMSVHLGTTLETNIGLRNQNLMTDLSSLPTNVNPVAFNAVSVDANMSYKIDSQNTFVTNNNFTMTRVGGRVFLSTGIIHNNTSVIASYQGGVTPFPVGNTLQNVNLLQNFNNMDGFRLSLGQSFSNKSGTMSGTVSAYGGISTGTVKPLPTAGATIKLNLGTGVKRKPARTF